MEDKRIDNMDIESIQNKTEGKIAIALLISILIISFCSAISITMASKVISSDSVLNQERLRYKASQIVDGAINEFRVTHDLDIGYYNDTLDKVDSTSDNVKYIMEYKINTDDYGIYNISIKIVDKLENNTLVERSTSILMH